MAVRNLCEGNATAQAEIASYQKKPGTGTAAEGAAAGGAAADTGVVRLVVFCSFFKLLLSSHDSEHLLFPSFSLPSLSFPLPPPPQPADGGRA